MTSLRQLRFVTLLLMLPVFAAAQKPHHAAPKEPQVLAPGYSALTFPAPDAGSYTLPALGAAANGKLFDSDGAPVTLHELYDGKTIILSFIYTSCPDVNGCPLATYVLGKIQRGLASDPELLGKVRLLSVSFDPLNDSPEVMAKYGKSFRRAAVDWRFLTAASSDALTPILEEYDQSVIRDRDKDGREIGTMSHILRVFLIDPQKNIRNIYSPSFLHPDILLADIRTVNTKPD